MCRQFPLMDCSTSDTLMIIFALQCCNSQGNVSANPKAFTLPMTWKAGYFSNSQGDSWSEVCCLPAVFMRSRLEKPYIRLVNRNGVLTLISRDKEVGHLTDFLTQQRLNIDYT